MLGNNINMTNNMMHCVALAVSCARYPLNPEPRKVTKNCRGRLSAVFKLTVKAIVGLSSC